MLCRYEMDISCTCPNDGKHDVYKATFESDGTIMCERIVEAVSKYKTETAYQEAITADLAKTLGCKVTTIGYHSGVKTTVVAP